MKKNILLFAITMGISCHSFAQNSNLQKWIDKKDNKEIPRETNSNNKRKVPAITKEEIQKEIDILKEQREILNKKISDKEILLRNMFSNNYNEMDFADSLLNAEKNRRNERILDFLNKHKNIPFYNVTQTRFTFKEEDSYTSQTVFIPKLSKCLIDTILYNTQDPVNEAYHYPITIVFKVSKIRKFRYNDKLNYQSMTLASTQNQDFINKSLEEEYPNIRFKNYIENGQVKIGMNKLEAELSWGRPLNIKTTTGSWGVHEQWIYKNSYLYFENGVLTTIQE